MLPFLAAAGSLFGGGGGGGLPSIGGDTSSAQSGPIQAGPVVVNVSGFGGRSSGSAEQAGTFPASGGIDGGAGADVGLPHAWVTPLAILGAFAVAALLLRKG